MGRDHDANILRERHDLVLHERDEGRHHHCHTPRVHGRVLVAQALAVPRRHHNTVVTLVHQNRVDDLPLQTGETNIR